MTEGSSLSAAETQVSTQRRARSWAEAEGVQPVTRQRADGAAEGAGRCRQTWVPTNGPRSWSSWAAWAGDYGSARARPTGWGRTAPCPTMLRCHVRSRCMRMIQTACPPHASFPLALPLVPPFLVHRSRFRLACTPRSLARLFLSCLPAPSCSRVEGAAAPAAVLPVVWLACPAFMPLRAAGSRA